MSIKPLVFVTVIGLSSLPLTAYAEGYFYEYDPSGGIPFTDRAPNHLDIHDNGGYGNHNFLNIGQQGEKTIRIAVRKTSARQHINRPLKQK